MNRKALFAGLLTLALMGGLSLSAFAETRVGFGELDADGDGVLTEAELSSYASQTLSEEASDAQVARLIDRYDTDGDGEISAAEVSGQTDAAAERAVERLDSDGDGTVSSEEFESAETEAEERRSDVEEDVASARDSLEETVSSARDEISSAREERAESWSRD